MSYRISVIGAGSWGSALAKHLARKGDPVRLWAFEKEVSRGINENHRNPLYLTDFEFPKKITATSSLEEALSGSDFVVSAVPSHALRRVWTDAASFIASDALLVSCTKGIEADTLKLMHEVLDDCLPGHPRNNRTVLSGPSFAKEVAASLPTSVVIAGEDAQNCKRVQEAFRSETFLTFTNDDVVGIEVGGAIKNVIAIAAGLSDGLNFGHNARAAIITRGLYEMIKIGRAMGARPLTFAGLSGIGDMILTCTAHLSRNYSVGFELGKGKTLNNIRDDMRMVAEGVYTAQAVKKLAKRYDINIPICDIVHRILFEELPPREAEIELCRLPLKEELGALMK